MLVSCDVGPHDVGITSCWYHMMWGHKVLVSHDVGLQGVGIT